ncbi:MAG: undecaprenyl-diphosphate phosphatase [Bacteroidaceae bacterium]|nr:undecaprenyl-diphosphate phosphatase [Paraprevotella sp.]MDY5078057.1 undecaprenyl-diphosphate phosphatase [Bacteroidaceae bacterium]MDY5266212.1 undecaprenyl-diphosphate phosphatase [Bacteroidaceae bacterium]
MNSLQALLLGLLQGLTEYLPVSSSGHLAIGAYLFGVDGEESMAFTIVVHVATVLSTLVILWREIVWILRGVWCQLTGKVSAQSAGSSSCSSLNAETRYAINILISMIPVGIVGLFFKEQVEEIFGSGLTIVGIMLLVTAALLVFSYYARPRQRENISPLHAFLIGIGQALAVMPGLSRSGTTIATGLLLGNKKERMAQFSFLMVIPPILGEALLDVLKLMKGDEAFGDIEFLPLAVGFLAAFVSGCAACRWMISIVRKGKLLYFGIYCALVALLVLFFA